MEGQLMLGDGKALDRRGRGVDILDRLGCVDVMTTADAAERPVAHGVVGVKTRKGHARCVVTTAPWLEPVGWAVLRQSTPTWPTSEIYQRWCTCSRTRAS